MKDIDPNFRKLKSLDDAVRIKEGFDSFVLALKDVIETKPSECPDDPNRGTYVSNYLKDNVNVFNSIIIADLVREAVENYLTDDYDVDVDNIQIIRDIENNEYILSIDVADKKESQTAQTLQLSLKITR